MIYQIKEIRLDKLNIPVETLRRSSTPAADRQLKESLDQHGLLIPLIVSKLGGTEYSVWDGTRRTRIMRELGYAGSKKVSALVAMGDDADSVVAQININQTRERLNTLAEAEGLRQLVQDHGYNQTDAAKKLLKTKSWASKVMKTWSLPKPVIEDIRSGNLPLTHALIITKFIEYPKIMNLLHKESLTGKATAAHIMALGKKAINEGIDFAKQHRPKRYKFGKKSFIRIEPLQKGVRAEVHLDEADSKSEAIKEFTRLIKKINLK